MSAFAIVVELVARELKAQIDRIIAQRLASRTGIAAHLAFPSPGAFFWQTLKA